MRKKRPIAIVLVCLFVMGFSGCTVEENWKNSVLDTYNHIIQSFSTNALTKDPNLQGKRQLGEDSYTGRYNAEYRSFSGKEILFGGTALKREKGNQLRLTFTLKIDSGAGVLYWLERGEKHIITEAAASKTTTITLSAGDHYLVLEGKDLTGYLALTVQ